MVLFINKSKRQPKEGNWTEACFRKKKLMKWSLHKIYSLTENLFIWKSLDVDEDEVLDEVSIHEFIV